MEGQDGSNARIITLILAGSAGLCAGFVGGFLAAHRLAEKRYANAVETRVGKELEEIKAYYRSRVEQADREAEAFVARRLADIAGQDSKREPAVGEERPPGSPPRTVYNRPVHAAPPRPVLPADADESSGGGDLPAGSSGDAGDDNFWPAEEPDPGDPGVSPVEPLGSGIEIITRTEFDDDEEVTYQKVSITYYEGDKVLTDDHDVPVRNNAEIVGVDFVSHFGEPDDPDIVYVRNHRLGMDFEIARKESGYAEEVLGYRKPL